MRIDEIAVRQKAGVIPYYVDKTGKLMMMFMTPSDPAYGGSQFQIAKGGIDSGEDAQEAALREGEEELGLRSSNIASVQKLPPATITGLDATYHLTVYAVQVKNPTAFGTPHYETGKRAWLTFEKFKAVGRANQLAVVQQAAQTLSEPLDRGRIS